MRLSRRHLLATSLAAAAPAAGALPVGAENWPSRPIRLVVPASAGAGILDIMARLTSQPLSIVLGRQIVVDNRPGASGNIGVESVAQSAPDGYTLMVANIAMVVSPFFYARPGFDPIKSFVPVVMVSSSPLMLVVHPSLPVKTVAEFIAYARANPGRLYYGSAGAGSTPFLTVELLKSLAGFDAVNVPYKGGAPALADLVAGQTAFMIENVPGTLPFVRDGKLRALAVTTSHRSALVPDLPTLQEAGVAGYEVIGWTGFFAPVGTPREIVDKVHDTTAGVLATAQVSEQLARLGAEAGTGSPSEFAAFVAAEHARWGKIIRDKGIKPE
jgi:tripartite-type tricarboxylate transporter receptor subunit TctC